MVQFRDLKFKTDEHGYSRARLFFSNGYGVSVVTGAYGYTDEGEYELAVLKGTVGDWYLDYDNPITDEIGHLNPKELIEVINRVKAL